MKYETVYIDLDDTIVIKNIINPLITKFLKKCIIWQKRIILLTKHSGDLLKTLNNYGIKKNLFTKIIHLNPSDEKAYYIKRVDSIFIDDSFHERKKVSDICKIPTFDVTMIEFLIH